jgi:histidinol-phosphate aminotransferase
VSVRCLRSDLPGGPPFTVTEAPHLAKLDQNEAPVDLPAELKRELAAAIAAAPWNRYPQPREYRDAKKKLAEAIGQPPEAVALTVGCDQVIQAAFLLGGGPGRRARWFEPTYPFVALMSRVTGTIGEGLVMGADVDAKLDASVVTATPGPQLVVLVAPNNPTGGMPQPGAAQAAVADDERLVLVDEAYADFAGESVLDDAALAGRPNLLVGRSLSKALLAGARLGFAVGHPEVIEALERIYTAPYHLNLMQLAVASRYGDVLPHVRAAARAVVAERERVAAALAARGVATAPSRGNFLLFAQPGAAEVHASLAARGVRIRDVSRLPGLGSHLRVTIGTAAENDAFLAALGETLSTA